MLSRRANWDAPPNRLTVARGQLASPPLDLTISNPTTAGLDYPDDEIAEIYASASRSRYDPQPRGLASAREAVAAQQNCSPDDLLLTASTSEAYSFLFKLLTDPGDAVLTAIPSYPLLDHLAQLEQVRLETFPLRFHKRWEIELSAIERSPVLRAIVVVNPNNPTGSFATPDEQDRLASLRIPIISDEVFLDYPLQGRGQSLVRQDVLSFALGGLSKSAGLPHFKLGWIRVSGPENEKREALRALEWIADDFLSVSTPVQAALPRLLALAPRIRDQIRRRTRQNLDDAASLLRPAPAASLLPVEGGWSAVIRVPAIESDEDLAIRLLQEAGVVVHPGYFFDFDSDGYFVVSLLTAPDMFTEGIRRIVPLLPA